MTLNKRLPYKLELYAAKALLKSIENEAAVANAAAVAIAAAQNVAKTQEKHELERRIAVARATTTKGSNNRRTAAAAVLPGFASMNDDDEDDDEDNRGALPPSSIEGNGHHSGEEIKSRHQLRHEVEVIKDTLKKGTLTVAEELRNKERLSTLQSLLGGITTLQESEMIGKAMRGEHSGDVDYYDDDEQETANLYIGNLPFGVTEDMLIKEYGIYGSITSVKIMYPRTDEERSRGYVPAFIAFSSRDEAQAAKDAMESGPCTFGGAMMRETVLRVGWGKAMNSAQVKTAQRNKNMLVQVAQQQEQQGEQGERTAIQGSTGSTLSRHIHVEIPKSDTHRSLIDKIARMVADNGRNVEQVAIMRVQARNGRKEKYNFLFDYDSPDGQYYRWRTFAYAQGDSGSRWRTEPFIMCQANPLSNDPSGPGGRSRIKIGGKALLPSDKALFMDMLHNLNNTRRDSIKEIMVWCIDHTDSSIEIVDIIVDEIVRDSNDDNNNNKEEKDDDRSTGSMIKQIALLYLISDILHNSGCSTKNGAWSYRTQIEGKCALIMATFGKRCRMRMRNRNRNKSFVNGELEKCCNVLNAWEQNAIFAPEYLKGYHKKSITSIDAGAQDDGIDGESVGSDDISIASSSLDYDDEDDEDIDDNSGYHGTGVVEFTILPHTRTDSNSSSNDNDMDEVYTTNNNNNHNLSDNSKTFINSLLCFMGSGILGLPHAFNEIGLIGGIIILSFIAGLALHCMLLIVHCQSYLRDNRAKHAVTYGDIGYYAFGNIGTLLVDICVILTQTGFAVAYLIFISHNLYDTILHHGGSSFLTDDDDDATTNTSSSMPLSRGTILLLISPPLVILSWLRHLKMLAPFSLLAEIAIIFALIALFIFDINSIISQLSQDADVVNQQHQQGVEDNTTITTNNAVGGEEEEEAPQDVTTLIPYNVNWWLNLSRLPYFFGISVYCYEGVGMVMPIKNSMQNPSSFDRIWRLSMILVTTVYCAFGALGLLAFSHYSYIDSIITRALPNDTILSPLIQVSLCIGLYLTYPLMLFPVFELMDVFFNSNIRPYLCSNVSNNSNNSSPGMYYHLLTHYIFRLGYVSLTAILAAYIPNFGAFISLVGASASATLAFILPPAFHIKLRGRELSKWQYLRELVCIMIGFAGGIIGTVEACKDALGALQGQDVEG
ncbi:amino acid transporter, putative [Perkinsus marinus ATCC 50983]|uniref:Amino acid transporter, putative n=1 Tax=Perkinsus marinus (strain ATCC 50983 / TXsc) TaxID=423536 RepID=C5KMR9_PERM5|nr:amino acid transporter, putative [Perkinsus marinus ATCC 50983]EER14227.1 amino acid transporter, putative [Perkinsus marinus ATCC 50983]|eukprot:XP_002782432.1 amino acid transporter, putative [Perkinsus marinus ATCC 50983]